MGALRINSNYGFESGWDEPSAEVRNTLGLTDTLNKILGKHSITAGIDLLHQHAVENTAYPTQPLIGFGRSGTGGGHEFLYRRISGRLYVGCRIRIHARRRRDCRCGRLAGWSLLPGRLEDSSQPDHQPRIALGSEHASRLQGGRGAAWVPGANTVTGFANSAPGKQSIVFPNAPAGLLFPGDPGVTNTLMNSDYGYWEPRIGLAWQPKGLAAHRLPRRLRHIHRSAAILGVQPRSRRRPLQPHL